ncbi:MAG: MBL fold metallo-hydrolase [Cytophagaceae bacterium]|nr:MBL fold metallo-hydrolase [Cytophagaceae bacterium]
MQLHQFYDESLAHASYAILSETTAEVLLVDPARNPQPYYDWADERGAKIVAVVETHPHADFVSSHLELAQTSGAQIFQSKLVNPAYAYVPFDDGDVLTLGECTYVAINTPGHSPDSICLVLKVDSKTYAIFTGDTLFIGDVGRPDLRENVGNVTADREQLARQMYHSTREKLMKFPPETLVYPAHGAGSLCGKNLSEERVSTIGQELADNFALSDMSEDEFVAYLLADQPFVPQYFEFDVELNKTGAPPLAESLALVPRVQVADVQPGVWIVDTRPQDVFKLGHLPHSINLMEGGKFETWLGSLLAPGEAFYLAAADEASLNELLERVAKIGYETQVKGIVILEKTAAETSPVFDLEHFSDHENDYTILDIRNASEVAGGKLFDNALSIPLPELRERAHELPTDKPIVVHCAGGYRSAAGSSLLQNILPGATVYDLGEAVTRFQGVEK